MATDFERFWERVEIAPSGCWLWTADKNRGGYGRFRVRVDGVRRYVQAHRWSYEHYCGPIPDGLTIDHLCHNRDESCNRGNACLHRACVNPAHLGAATQRTNVLRGRGEAAKNAVATHCKRGHPLSGENLAVLPDGRRQCRTCMRAKVRKWQRTEHGKAVGRSYETTPQRRAYLKRYRKENAERDKEYQRAYYQQNRDRVLAAQKERREADPAAQAERDRANRRRYYEKHADEIRAKRRARREANLEVERARDREYQRRRREARRADA